MNKFLPYILSLLVVSSSAFAELQASGFEGGDFAGWNTQGDGWSIYTKAASEGKKSAMVKVSKGEAAGLKAAAKQILGVDPGSVIKVEFDVAGKVKSGSSKLTASVICVDASGSVLREVKKSLSRPSTDFTQLKLPEMVVPSGTAEAYLMLVIELPKPASGNEWWRFDSVSIDVS